MQKLSHCFTLSTAFLSPSPPSGYAKYTIIAVQSQCVRRSLCATTHPNVVRPCEIVPTATNNNSECRVSLCSRAVRKELGGEHVFADMLTTINTENGRLFTMSTVPRSLILSTWYSHFLGGLVAWWLSCSGVQCRSRRGEVMHTWLHLRFLHTHIFPTLLNCSNFERPTRRTTDSTSRCSRDL